MRRSAKLTVIKATHTVVFVLSAGAIFYAHWAGITGTITPLLWISLCIPALVWLGIRANGNECILQTWARRLEDSQGWVSDIYIPDWLAIRVRAIFTPLYALAAALVCVRLVSSL